MLPAIDACHAYIMGVMIGTCGMVAAAVLYSADGGARHRRHLRGAGEPAGRRPAFASLQALDIGQELLLIGRHTLSDHFLLQAVAGLAFPGAAIRQAVPGSPNPWTSLQLSLFMVY